MSSSTTGFILTENKNVFEVMGKVERCLIDLVKKHQTAGVWIFSDEKSAFPMIRLRPTSRAVTVYFRVCGEDRELSVHFDCDHDYSEYGDSKVIWSVNPWGKAEEIVQTVGYTLQEGDGFYFCADDSVSDEFIKIAAPEPMIAGEPA